MTGATTTAWFTKFQALGIVTGVSGMSGCSSGNSDRSTYGCSNKNRDRNEVFSLTEAGTITEARSVTWIEQRELAKPRKPGSK